MNRRRFLQSLAGLALGACVGVQRVLPLVGRVEVEDEPVLGVDMGAPGGDATVYYVCTRSPDGRYTVGDIITVQNTPSG